jgi:alpha-pyrone synthase
MARRSGIEHRYSCLAIGPQGHEDQLGALDGELFYVRGRFPDTATRMQMFETRAPELAAKTVEKLRLEHIRDDITHLLITCCTGFSAPGVCTENLNPHIMVMKSAKDRV